MGGKGKGKSTGKSGWHAGQWKDHGSWQKNYKDSSVASTSALFWSNKKIAKLEDKERKRAARRDLKKQSKKVSKSVLSTLAAAGGPFSCVRTAFSAIKRVLSKFDSNTSTASSCSTSTSGSSSSSMGGTGGESKKVKAVRKECKLKLHKMSKKVNKLSKHVASSSGGGDNVDPAKGTADLSNDGLISLLGSYGLLKTPDSGTLPAAAPPPRQGPRQLPTLVDISQVLAAAAGSEEGDAFDICDPRARDRTKELLYPEECYNHLAKTLQLSLQPEHMTCHDVAVEYLQAPPTTINVLNAVLMGLGKNKGGAQSKAGKNCLVLDAIFEQAK